MKQSLFAQKRIKIPETSHWLFYVIVIPGFIFLNSWFSAELTTSSNFNNQDSGCGNNKTISPVAWLAVAGTFDLLFFLISLIIYVYSFAYKIFKELQKVGLFNKSKDNNAQLILYIKNIFPDIPEVAIKYIQKWIKKLQSSSFVQTFSKVGTISDNVWKVCISLMIGFWIFNFVWWIVGAVALWRDNSGCSISPLNVFMSFDIVIHMLVTMFLIPLGIVVVYFTDFDDDDDEDDDEGKKEKMIDETDSLEEGRGDGETSALLDQKNKTPTPTITNYVPPLSPPLSGPPSTNDTDKNKMIPKNEGQKKLNMMAYEWK